MADVRAYIVPVCGGCGTILYDSNDCVECLINDAGILFAATVLAGAGATNPDHFRAVDDRRAWRAKTRPDRAPWDWPKDVTWR